MEELQQERLYGLLDQLALAWLDLRTGSTPAQVAEKEVQFKPATKLGHEVGRKRNSRPKDIPRLRGHLSVRDFSNLYGLNSSTLISWARKGLYDSVVPEQVGTARRYRYIPDAEVQRLVGYIDSTPPGRAAANWVGDCLRAEMAARKGAW